MSKIFISHSSQNDFQAIAIKEWLKNNGWDDVFLDLDPVRGIAAGERWEAALFEAADYCDAVIFLVSQAWLDSDWCIKEFDLAKSLNKLIFGVLIEEIELAQLPKKITDTWQLCNLAQSNDHSIFNVRHPKTGEEQHITYSAEGLNQFKAGLDKAGLDPKYFQWPPENDPNRSPYRGMLPLEAEDAGIFFGREVSTIKMLGELRGLRATNTSNIEVVLGASGAGKSSFIRAGVIPRLQRDERNFLTLPIIRPKSSILWGDKGLLSSITQYCINNKYNMTKAVIRELINNNHTKFIELLKFLSFKAKVPTLYGVTNPQTPTIILTIDQSEELFQNEGNMESNKFLQLLSRLVKDNELSIILLFIIRTDSYEYLQSNIIFLGINQQIFNLTKILQADYKSIIEAPAKRLHNTNRQLEIDLQLSNQLLKELEDDDSKDTLPLLAFTLERLYLDYGGKGDLTLEDYHQMGGLNGAIQAAVDIAFKNAMENPLLPDDTQEISKLLRKGMIPWLAGINPDTKSPMRRIVNWNKIPYESRPILNHLIEQRLLITDKQNNGEKTIEPAHESLLIHWELLRIWLEEDLPLLTTLENIQRASHDWLAVNKNEDYLVHNYGRLKNIELLKQRIDISGFLTKDDWGYLEVCRQHDDHKKAKELAKAKRLTKTQKKVTRSITVGLFIAIILGIISLY